MRALALTLIVAGCGASAGPRSRSEALAPPIAAIQPKRVVLHGDERIDNYYWLRNKDSRPVLDYLRKENQYTERMMAGLRSLESELFREMVGRLKETDSSVPVRDGNYFHYHRTEKGKQYPIYCRKRGSVDAPEQIVLDGNELARGNVFFDVEAFEYSDDDRYLAYSVDTTGFRDYQLQVLDTTTGKLGPENRDGVTSAVWAADNQTLFYVIGDEAKRPYQLYRHLRGQKHEQDVLLYEEKDQRFELEIDRTRSGDYLMLEIDSQTTSEVRFAPASQPRAPFRMLSARRADHQYEVDQAGDSFYILTNDRGRNFRLVKAPVATPEKWQELRAHSSDVMLDSLEVFKDFYVMTIRENGLPGLEIVRFSDQKPKRVAMPEAVYEIAPDENPMFDAAGYRYQYQSPATPLSFFEFRVADGKSRLLKQTEVLGGFDPNAYEVRRLWASASDGTKVPISVVAKKGLARPAPTFLLGYGAYGYPYDMGFDSAVVSLLDRGVMVATAHIRGGGEMGTRWHDAGRMMNKKNTFTDFIAAAEYLIAAGETDAKRLAINGRSAGGLLMGAVLNLRPDLFTAAVVEVPFVDVLNTMLDASIPLTVTEYEEWGNPNEPAAYQYMKGYCPYTNVSGKAYPAMLVTTSYNDSQVMYWEPAKYVAKLRATKTDRNPLLFRVNMAGGHGGSSGRYDQLREDANTYSFVLGVFSGALGGSGSL